MEQTLKEKTLERETETAPNAPVADTSANILDDRVMTALSAASGKKAVQPLVLDLREVADFTELFVITNGTNIRQVQAISDGIVDALRDKGTRPIRVEGYNTAEWILVDYGDFVVHIFEEKARQFYDLERLWRDAKRIEIPLEFQ